MSKQRESVEQERIVSIVATVLEQMSTTAKEPHLALLGPYSSESLSDAQQEIEWTEHPAWRVLKYAFLYSEIPLDHNQEPKSIFDKYKGTREFAGLNCDEAFAHRLRTLRDEVEDTINVFRASSDQQAYEIYRNEFLFLQEVDQNGNYRWEGSLAQYLLQQDIKGGLHLGKKPGTVQATREEYQQFSTERFHEHLNQEKKLWKLAFYFEVKANKKKQASINSNASALEKSDSASEASDSEASDSSEYSWLRKRLEGGGCLCEGWEYSNERILAAKDSST